MWGLYNNHEGFVLGFDTSCCSFKELGEPMKVDYFPHRPVYDPVKGAKGFWYQKEVRWQFENEWRISRRPDACKQRTIGGTTIHLCRISRDCIAKVYVGLRANKALEDQLSAALENSKTQLFRATLKPGASAISFQCLR